MEMDFIIIMCVLNAVCLITGAIIGQRTAKGLDINVPNPIKEVKQIVEEVRETREEREEQERLETMMENINNYHGSELGQKDV